MLSPEAIQVTYHHHLHGFGGLIVLIVLVAIFLKLLEWMGEGK